MDWNLVSAFVAVAEAGSFSAAAEHLGVQRAAVSRRVAALEAALGVVLFARSTRRVDLTSAGAALFADTAPLLHKLDAAVRGLPERSEVPAGELRVSAPADLGTWLLPKVLARLVATYPDLHPIVHLGNRVVDLHREGFDAALRVYMGAPPDSDLRSRPLGEVQLRPVASPAYLARRGTPQGVEDLPDHTWIALRGYPAPEGIRPGRPITVDDHVLARAMALEGAGIALLPDFFVVEDLREGRLRPLLPGRCYGAGSLHLVLPAHRELPPKTAVFRDAIVEVWTTLRAGQG